MSSAGYELSIPAIKCLQAYALNLMATQNLYWRNEALYLQVQASFITHVRRDQ
jgi:hypothetical protein